MKKCPNCGAANRPDNTVCHKCKTSLEGILAVQAVGNGPSGPAHIGFSSPQVTQPPHLQHSQHSKNIEPEAGGVLYGGGPLVAHEEHGEPVSTVGKPLNGNTGQSSSGAPPGAYGPQSPYAAQNPYGPQGPVRRPYPRPNASSRSAPRYSSLGSTLTTIATLLIVLGVGGFLTWKYLLLPKKPIEAARKFVVALTNNDAVGFAASLSQDSQKYAQFAKNAPGAMVNMNIFHSQNQGFDEEKQFKLEMASLDSTNAKVNVKPGSMPNEEFKDETLSQFGLKDGLPLVIVKEGNEWKVDLPKTLEAINAAGGTQYLGGFGETGR